MEIEDFLTIPYTGEKIYVGNIVRLGRFSDKDWKVCYGWYEFGGNRPVCGWYLTSDCGLTTKPFQLTDLDDVIVLKS